MWGFDRGARFEMRETYRSIHKEINDKLGASIKAVLSADLTGLGGEDVRFIQSLQEYLKYRSSDIMFFTDNFAQIKRRAEFIQNVIDCIKSNAQNSKQDSKQNALIELLSEENIKPFKGFFSQRLYDILAARRTALLPVNREAIDQGCVKLGPARGWR